MAGALIGKVRGIWDGIAAYARDRRRCALIRRDLDSLGPDEHRHLLDQYDLTVEEFEKSLRVPFASEDMSSRALRAVGVDPQLFHHRHGVRSRAMRRACTLCQAKTRCRQDLSAGSFVQNHRDYCPNRLHFAILLARQAYPSTARLRS